MRLPFFICCALLGLFTAGAFLGQTGAGKLPPLKRRAGPQAVVDEHLDALNRCDWERLMAQYPPEVEIFLPGEARSSKVENRSARCFDRSSSHLKRAASAV